MSKIIPAEIFNTHDVPASGNVSVRVSDYLKTVIYRMPNCSDLMIEREIWNTICEFCDRSGALREKQIGALDSTKSMTLTTPAYGEFQRIVGAGLSSSPVSITKISVVDTATFPKVTFTDGSSGSSAYVSFSVVPNFNASHDKTPVTVGSTTTYPNDKWIAPKWFFSIYDKLIVAGANFRLFGMSNRPWTDYNSARANAIAYNSEINRVTHGLITSGMRKDAVVGSESAFIGNAEAALSRTVVK